MRVHVRPELESPSISVLSKDTKVKVFLPSETQDWVKVQTPQLTGWTTRQSFYKQSRPKVKKRESPDRSDLSVTKTLQKTEERPYLSLRPPLNELRTAAREFTIREEPLDSADPVAVVPAGASVQCLGVKSSCMLWVKASFNTSESLPNSFFSAYKQTPKHRPKKVVGWVPFDALVPVEKPFKIVLSQ